MKKKDLWLFVFVEIIIMLIIIVLLVNSNSRGGGFVIMDNETKEDNIIPPDNLSLVTRVIDGDTIDIDIPDGQYEHTRIRLWGIDTPETKSEKAGVMYFGPEATDFTRKLTLGEMVGVYLDKQNRTRGKYGRLLAYVQLPDDKFLNEVLLSKGFGYADVRFRHSFYNKYRQLEAAARSQKRGLWEKVTPEQWPQWRRNSYQLY